MVVLISFWDVSWRYVGQQEAPKAPPRRPKALPGQLQGASKTDPSTLRMVRTVPSCSKGRPEALQASILDPPDFDFVKLSDLDFESFDYRSWRGGGDAALQRFGV